MDYSNQIEIPLPSTKSFVELRELCVDTRKLYEQPKWVVGVVDVGGRFIEIPQEHEGTLASALTVAAGYVAEYTETQESIQTGTKQCHVFTCPLYPSIPGGC